MSFRQLRCVVSGGSDERRGVEERTKICEALISSNGFDGVVLISRIEVSHSPCRLSRSRR